MKYRIILILVIVLTACTPSQSSIQTAVAQTQTVQVTISSEMTQTQTTSVPSQMPNNHCNNGMVVTDISNITDDSIGLTTCVKGVIVEIGPTLFDETKISILLEVNTNENFRVDLAKPVALHAAGDCVMIWGEIKPLCLTPDCSERGEHGFMEALGGSLQACSE
ncbi:MAG: hypothetical protein HOG15_10685 [Anaerolineae bacterium]|jgi:hypothetical protein|nr:hypothetical protein [Anaerolineae bacterium]